MVPSTPPAAARRVAVVPHRGHSVRLLDGAGYRPRVRSSQSYGDRPGSSRVGRAC